MSKIRLLVDAHVFDEVPQGTRTYIEGLYREIVSINNPDLQIYFCAHSPARLKELFGSHPNIFYLKISSLRVLRICFEIPMLIWKYRINFAHFQYVSPLFQSCREIVTIHDVLFLEYPQYFPVHYRKIKKILFRRSAARAHLLLTVSEYSRLAISRYFKIAKERIFITPNGISSEYRDKVPELLLNTFKKKYGFEKYILYVSRFEPRKNQTLLLKVFFDLKLWDLGYSLIFVGRKDLKSKNFTGFISELNSDIKKNVIILEDLTSTELRAFYQHCDLFVYPSLAEGFGIPPLEAAASGAMVLCSNRTAMGDYKFFGDFFFDPTNEQALKEKITRFLGQKDRYSHEISRIQNYVLVNYNWKVIAAAFVKTLLAPENE